ncbi:MAG TPA: hypothetical protein VKT70_04330, partial [Stellaceae bacterium]|nr:hypothetical protein [Stellaceae bacterium]
MPDRGRWREKRAIAAYPERASAEPGKLDRFLAQLHGQIRFALQRGGGARLARMADAVDALGPEFEALPEDALKRHADELRLALARAGFADPVVAR